MEPLQLAIAGLVAAAVFVFVAHPLLRRSQHSERQSQQQVSPCLALLEQRDRALAALKELEFDHRTGKISDSDYRSLLPPLRREAAEALRTVATADARAIPCEQAKRKVESRKRVGSGVGERR